MRNLVSFVLGGGKGTRLDPLTRYRSKPAVPLAGKYRLIDIPISNCINSDIKRIYLLTQFMSVSLHRHIRRTYNFDRFSGGFVEILAAQQMYHADGSSEGLDWYQGTADAVRKNLRYFDDPSIEYVLILSGDQLYRMNYRAMLETHIESGADVTIAGLPVTEQEAAAFGIMIIDDDGRVTDFVEKPKTAEELDPVRTDPAWLDSKGIQSRGRDCLASMGIYLFNRKCLVDLLQQTEHEDFGKQVFPMAIENQKVQLHPFDGYWEDIGTIKSFYDANIALGGSNPPFDFNEPNSPIYTRTRFLPPTRMAGASCKNSLIADGCLIGDGAVIENSVVGLRCRIGRGVTIRNSILMGNDYYDESDDLPQAGPNAPALGIGDESYIENSIIDKNCRVGHGTRVWKNPNLPSDHDFPEGVIRDGIVVLERGAILPDGWSL